MYLISLDKVVHKLTCAGGFPLPFFPVSPPNNKTVPEGVMQGL